jgi:diguanylate cyclase (GGDEF)-like protein/PAS domain S-box-containing protein
MEQLIENTAVPSTACNDAKSKLVDFNYMFRWSSLSVMVTNSENLIIYVNPSFERLTGYWAEEAIGLTPKIMRSGQHSSEFYRAIWKSVRQYGNWQGEIWNRNKTGHTYPASLSINRIVDERTGEICYLGLFCDISLHKQKEEILNYEATHDLLTGLANNAYMRRHLDRVLSLARAQCRALAVLYIDLDGFKTINDQCGHHEGDSVLKLFAQILKSSIRETDFVARAGGDEFVVILNDLELADKVAFEVAEKILATLPPSLEFASSNFNVGCSIGISTFPGNGATANELLKAADMAMYKAKRQGGGYLLSMPDHWIIPASQKVYVQDAGGDLRTCFYPIPNAVTI